MCVNCNGRVEVELLFYRHPMKLRDWSVGRWALILAAIIVLPLIGLRLHLKWQVHRAVAGWRAAGHPVSLSELLARQSKLPTGDNAFFLLTNAYRFIPLPSESELRLVPVLGTYSSGLLEKDGWPELVEKATTTYLARQKAALDLAALAVERPAYWEPFNGVPDQGVNYRLLAKLISLQLQYELHSRHREAGINWLVVQCRLGSLRAGGGTDFNSHVGGAVLRMALENIAHLLRTGNCTAAELRRLREATRPAIRNWRMDRTAENAIASGLELFHWGTQRVPILNADRFWMETTPRQKLFEDLQILLYRMSGLADQDTLYFLEVMQTNHTASAESLAAMSTLAASWPSVLPRARGYRFHNWSQFVLQTTGSLINDWVVLQGELRAADAALAVAQYRLQHDGKLPGSLDQLVPEFWMPCPSSRSRINRSS